MRMTRIDDATASASEQLLTTGEAATILGASRQHVVNLCEAGDLPFITVGTHRRIRRADVEVAQARTRKMSRDQRRSQWLNTAIAGKLVADPEAVLSKARHNATAMLERGARGQARVWLERWKELLDEPPDRVIEALTSPSPWARELRQNSPFAGVLTEDERRRVLESFSTTARAGS